MISRDFRVERAIAAPAENYNVKAGREKDPAEVRCISLLPDLRRLRAFIVLAEELHYGRAAKRLNMSQSPLSRLIISFETDIGFELFSRSRRSVHLTDAGISLLTDVRQIVLLTEAALVRAFNQLKS